VLFIIRSRHQLVFGVGKLQISYSTIFLSIFRLELGTGYKAIDRYSETLLVEMGSSYTYCNFIKVLLIIVEGTWVKICIQIVILDPFDPLDFFYFFIFSVEKISLETCRKKLPKE